MPRELNPTPQKKPKDAQNISSCYKLCWGALRKLSKRNFSTEELFCIILQWWTQDIKHLSKSLECIEINSKNCEP